MAVIDEEVWFGRSRSFDSPASGGGRQLNSQSIHGRTHPPERTIHWHIPFGIAAPGDMVLPDARTLPLGGPLYHFIVTADPGVTAARWYTFDVDASVSFVPPVAVKWYLCANTTTGGQWSWKVATYNFVSTADLADITNYGTTSGGSLGAIDKYGVFADTWSFEADSGEDWSTCGVSWTGSRSLIRKGSDVWSHTAGVTSFQTPGGPGNIDKCSFIRMSGQSIGTRHYGFGNFDLGSHGSDYYEFTGNSFTVIADNPTSGWNEGESSGIGGDQPAADHHIIQILAYVDIGAQVYPTFLFNVISAVYAVIPPTNSQGHYARCPAVTLQFRVHLMGGAAGTTDLIQVNSRWHHAFILTGLSGWIARPWIPNPVRGHGCQYLPNPGAQRQCVFGMGRDHSFFPSDNVLGFRYNDTTEAYIAAGSFAWSGRQEQGTSWGHLD